MAKIKIEIDTESYERESTRKVELLAGMKKVRVISPITITQAMLDAFTDGMNISSDLKHSDKHGYKRGDNSKLKQAIKDNNSADLIATAGGLAAYDAARSDAVTNFVSVIGAITPPFSNSFKGCVSLESYASNTARIALLHNDFGFQIKEIGLFYNPNSYMDKELDNWISLVGNKNQAFPGGNDNLGGTYNADFGNIPVTGSNAIKALVISADPFFQDTKDDLIAAANTWVAGAGGRYVCYPTQDYSNRTGTHKPTPQKATLFGPDLATAYSLLGQLAAVVLSGGSGLNLRLGNTRTDL
jgi:hypothetical protein